MTENTTTETEVADNLGNQLRQARETLNLSIEDVARKINLRASVLQKFENNNFVDPNIPPIFMRGYIRNYLKFLKLPESLLNNLNTLFGEVPKNNLNKNTRAQKAINSYSSHNRWVSTITWIIVLIAIAMSVLWWWENHQQSNAERDNLVENYVSANNRLNDNPDRTTAIVPAVSLNDIQNPLVLTVNYSETPANTMTTESVEQAAVRSEPFQLKKTESQQEAAAQPESAVNSEEDPAAQHAAPAEAELRIEVTGSSCWLSVKDNNRKEQAGKLYKQGEILTYNTGAPYSLIVGAPGNVKITYQGNEIPLKVDGKVKKFKLPQ